MRGLCRRVLDGVEVILHQQRGRELRILRLNLILKCNRMHSAATLFLAMIGNSPSLRDVLSQANLLKEPCPDRLAGEAEACVWNAQNKYLALMAPAWRSRQYCFAATLKPSPTASQHAQQKDNVYRIK